MTDSVAIKVPENKEVTLNQETEMNHQMAELDQLLVTEEERSFYRRLTTLQPIILQKSFHPQ